MAEPKALNAQRSLSSVHSRENRCGKELYLSENNEKMRVGQFQFDNVVFDILTRLLQERGMAGRVWDIYLLRRVMESGLPEYDGKL